MATKHSTHIRGKASQRGLSVIELAVVMAIVAIVAATAVPSFTALIDARRLDAAALRLAADVQFVRGEAVARTGTLRLSIRAGSDATCWIVHTGAPADCTCAAAAAACSGEAMAIKSVVLPNSERVTVSGNVGSIAFDPLHGTSTPTGTLRLTGARGRAVHHVVNVLGRVRSCTPDGGVPGYPTC
jgi:type IV fimbrial biogenesis protein FimT